MPELPEVETVRLGLSQVLVGNSFASVEQRRKDLRFPLPRAFATRLKGRTVTALDRRAKYLLASLDGGEVLVMHLGMTGRFSIDHANSLQPPSRLAVAKGNDQPTSRSRGKVKEGMARQQASPPPLSGRAREGGELPRSFDETRVRTKPPKHEHIVFHMRDGTSVRYADTRRFGYMDLIKQTALPEHPLFKGLGIEPLDPGFTPDWLASRLKGKKTSIKAALVDQRLIAGLGNIYACEALYRAGISPLRQAGALVTEAGAPAEEAHALVVGIKAVIGAAIRAGGSSLRDYKRADGRLGRFQHSFAVYRREGKPCRKKTCGGIVRRIVQGGRSTFYCPACQK